MKFLYVVLLFLAFSVKLFPHQKLDSLVTLGNEQSFQFEFSKANQIFEQVIDKYPNSCLGYYFISRNNLWFYVANKDSVSKNKYLNYVEIALSKAETEFDENSESAVNNYNLGNVYLLKSIYASTEQNTMDAFWSTKKAVNYFEEAIELDSNFYAPYLGVGTIKYALGFVPGFLGLAISVAGLDGEKSEGLNLILKAYQNTTSHLIKVEAAYHLGKIYTEFNAEYDNAEKYLSTLVNNYPKNELFLYQYAILQIDKHNLKTSEKYLDKILFDSTKHKFFQTYALSLFLKGEISFKQNDFAKAISDYQNFIKESNSIDYTGIAYLKIAISYLMLDDVLNANKYFLLARNGNQNIAEDSFATEMSKELFNKKFSKIDKLIVESQNNLESGQYKFVIKQLVPKKASKEEVFKMDLILAEVYQQIHDFQRSGQILKTYSNLDDFSEYYDFARLLYLKTNQAYFEKRYAFAKEILQEAYKNLNEHDNKLNRLLINLDSKLTFQKEQ